MILIISNTQDLTADFVVRELSKRAVPFARLNTDEFPWNAFGSASFGFESTNELLYYRRDREKKIDFDSVRAIWFRRPVQPILDPSIQDQSTRQFCIDESYEFLRGLWLSQSCYWMSHPESIKIAEHKIVQLKMAASIGFRIPKTVITNDPNGVRNLYQNCKNGIIVKALYIGFLKDSDGPKYIYTSSIPDEAINDLASVKYAPSIYQEKIVKQFDLRITIVGEKVFAARIDADLPIETPDWRIAPIDKLKHSRFKLPVDIEQACLKLIKSLNIEFVNIEFGAIDMAVDENGQFVFFEINPNGQWAWLETALDFQISSAIVDRLQQFSA